MAVPSVAPSAAASMAPAPAGTAAGSGAAQPAACTAFARALGQARANGECEDAQRADARPPARQEPQAHRTPRTAGSHAVSATTRTGKAAESDAGSAEVQRLPEPGRAATVTPDRTADARPEPSLHSSPVEPAPDPSSLIAALLGQQLSAAQPAGDARRGAWTGAEAATAASVDGDGDRGASASGVAKAVADARTEAALARIAADASRTAAGRAAGAQTSRAADFADALTAAGEGRSRQAGPTPADIGPTPTLVAHASASAGLATSAGAIAADARLPIGPAHPDFARQLGAQLTTFVRDGVEFARIQLHPAELGPITVQIQLDGQAAQVHLAAERGDTRQALDAALPTLAGSLRDAGLTLAGGGVFQQARDDTRPGGDQGATAHTPSDGGESRQERDAARIEATAVVRRRGVIDLIA